MHHSKYYVKYKRNTYFFLLGLVASLPCAHLMSSFSSTHFALFACDYRFLYAIISVNSILFFLFLFFFFSSFFDFDREAEREEKKKEKKGMSTFRIGMTSMVIEGPIINEEKLDIIKHYRN